MNSTLEYLFNYFFDFIDFLKTVYPFPSVSLIGSLFDFSLYHLLVAFSFVAIGVDIILGSNSKDE